MTELVPEQSALGSRSISPDEPVFLGHFPGNPILPGVLILEALGQLGAILFSEPVEEGRPPSSEGKFFARIDRARFLRPVLPGQTLELEVKVLKAFGDFVKASGEARVNGETVTTAELTFTIGKNG